MRPWVVLLLCSAGCATAPSVERPAIPDPVPCWQDVQAKSKEQDSRLDAAHAVDTEALACLAQFRTQVKAQDATSLDTWVKCDALEKRSKAIDDDIKNHSRALDEKVGECKTLQRLAGLPVVEN